MLSLASLTIVRNWRGQAAAAAAAALQCPARVSAQHEKLRGHGYGQYGRHGRQQERGMTTLGESKVATDAYRKSCYFEMDFTIADDATVYEAVQRFSAFNIGALVTVDSSGKPTGVISERDYITKVALLGRTSKETTVKEIATRSSNLVTATPDDPIEICMEKMLSKDIRHLPLLDDKGHVSGMLSIKDIVKVLLDDRDNMIKTLSNFALGKGGHFIED